MLPKDLLSVVLPHTWLHVAGIACGIKSTDNIAVSIICGVCRALETGISVQIFAGRGNKSCVVPLEMI